MLQRRIVVTVQMYESSETGVERGPYLIYRAVEENVVLRTEDTNLAVLARKVASVEPPVSPKAMARFETLETGNERVHSHPSPNKSGPQEKVADHEQTMDQEPKVSETAKLHQLLGVKVDLKVKALARKKDRDHPDVSFKSDLSPSARPPPPIKTTNGVAKCDLTHQLHQLQSHLFYLVKGARPQLLQPSHLPQLVVDQD